VTARGTAFGFEWVEVFGPNAVGAFFCGDHGVCSSAMLISMSINQQSWQLSIVFVSVAIAAVGRHTFYQFAGIQRFLTIIVLKFGRRFYEEQLLTVAPF
jgi:hypothetical protein